MKISIIIPVYNTIKYLEQCFESIMAQSENSFEVIVIDDGSTDGSGDFCNQYILKDLRFRVIHQDNAGVSAARNRGLKEAEGEFVFFMDSDDILPPDAFESLLSKSNMAELVVGGIEEIQEDGKSNGMKQSFMDQMMSKENFLWALFDEKRMGYQGYLCNKLYRKSIIDQYNIQFDEDIYYNEDRLFIANYLVYCECIQMISTTVYLYRQRKESALGQQKSAFKVPFLTELDANEKMKLLVKENYSDLYAYISRLNYEKGLYWLKRIPPEFSEQRTAVKNVVKENAKICLSVPGKGVAYKAKIITRIITLNYVCVGG